MIVSRSIPTTVNDKLEELGLSRTYTKAFGAMLDKKGHVSIPGEQKLVEVDVTYQD